MQHQSDYYCCTKSRSVSPKRTDKSNRRHRNSRSLSNENIPSNSTSSPSTINQTQSELASKITRKVYNVNIESGGTGNKKNPKLIRRAIDDPHEIGVVRRFGEGATPIFEREELVKRDDTRKDSSRLSSSRESSEKRRSSSPNNRINHRYDRNELEKCAQSSRQSRSRERRLYNKDKKKKSLSSPPAKTSYYLDSKREEDRIRRKYRDKYPDERKKHTRSHSRDRRRKHSRRSRSRSRSRSSSRLSHPSMMAVHPYPIAYYPPPYPYPAPFLPMDPLWRPFAPYPFPPRPIHPPHYIPYDPRHGMPGPSGPPPFIQNFRPRFNRR